MKSIFSLKIDCKNEVRESVSKILGYQPVVTDLWEMEISTEDVNAPVDCIDEFLKILDGKYDALKEIGIQRKNISIWYVYEYEQQCNMEFVPHQTKLLGDNGIVLCISCWKES
jgi:hypothetical protein